MDNTCENHYCHWNAFLHFKRVGHTCCINESSNPLTMTRTGKIARLPRALRDRPQPPH